MLYTCPDGIHPATGASTKTLVSLLLRLPSLPGTCCAATADTDAVGTAAELRFRGFAASVSNALCVLVVDRPFQVMLCDLSDLESVRRFARAFEEKHGGQLDVLVNNGEPRVWCRFSMVVSRSASRLVMREIFPA